VNKSVLIPREVGAGCVIRGENMKLLHPTVAGPAQPRHAGDLVVSLLSLLPARCFNS